jgi:hypothetical protein
MLYFIESGILQPYCFILLALCLTSIGILIQRDGFLRIGRAIGHVKILVIQLSQLVQLSFS